MALSPAALEFAAPKAGRRVAVLAVPALALISSACTEAPSGPEWQRAQVRWGRALGNAGHEAPEPRVREVMAPRAASSERCLSCHVGMIPDMPSVSGEALFRAHPPVAHEAAEFGCVACHGGRPDGLTRSEAHGRTDRFPEPLLPAALVEARCGSCHAGLVAPGPAPPGFEVATLLAGKAAFHEGGCLGCHRVGGAGARLARELSWIGEPAATLLSFGAELRAGSHWNKLLWHFEHPLVVAPLAAVAPMGADDAAGLRELQTYLLSLRGAAANDRGARGFPADGASLYGTFCSACHGDSAGGLDWSGRSQWVPALVGGGHASLAGRRLLRETIVHGRPLRGMPAWRADGGGLSEQEIDRIVDWLWSQQPAPPTLAEVTTESGDVERGRQLFAAHCAACHGDEGRGGDFGGALRGLPAPTVLAALGEGRPEAGMPAYAGLVLRDLRDLLALHASEDSWRPAGQAPRTVTARENAGLLFAGLCANCHGTEGEGREASSLRSEAWQAAVTDAQITMATLAGRPGARVPGWTHAGDAPLSAREALGLTAHVRSLRGSPETAAGSR
jgi:mono/diheme cytochrome c family protein